MKSPNIFPNSKPPIIRKKFQINCSFLETSSFHLPHMSLNGFLNRPSLINIIIAPYIIPTAKTTDKMKMPIFISIVIVELVFSFVYKSRKSLTPAFILRIINPKENYHYCKYNFCPSWYFFHFFFCLFLRIVSHIATTAKHNILA